MDATLLLKATLLLLLALCAGQLLRRAPAVTRHRCWSVAFAALLLLPLLTLTLPALVLPMPAKWERTASPAVTHVPVVAPDVVVAKTPATPPPSAAACADAPRRRAVLVSSADVDRRASGRRRARRGMRRRRDRPRHTPIRVRAGSPRLRRIDSTQSANDRGAADGAALASGE